MHNLWINRTSQRNSHESYNNWKNLNKTCFLFKSFLCLSSITKRWSSMYDVRKFEFVWNCEKDQITWKTDYFYLRNLIRNFPPKSSKLSRIENIS
jgi:hypothetical protein